MAAFSVALVLAAAAGGGSATLRQFEATLAAQDSATRALEQWCARRHIAEPAVIRATKLAARSNDPSRRMRRRLGLADGETLALRHVRLSCGQTPLSVAWNWYVPARLSPAMNAALRDGDVPFGKVVAPLGFRRVSLPTITGRGENCPAGTISTHRARLVLPDGRALAYVVECYTAANLGGGED